MVLIDCSVEPVGARLGYHADLRTRRAAGIGVGVTCYHAKLFDGILCGAKNASERKTIHLIIVVNTIEGHVALVGPASVDRAAAAVACSVFCLKQVKHT